MELPESLRAARFLLLRERPYMAVAAFALIPVEVPGLGKRALGDIGVDRFWRLYYDPEGIGRWSTEQLVGVLYHELWHLLNAHAERLRAWPAHIANLGGDLAINSIVQREGLCLPEDGVLPEQFGFPPNLTAEEYCERLQQQADSLPAESGGGLLVAHHGSCAHGRTEAWELPAEGSSVSAVSEAYAELIRRETALQIVEYAKSQGTVPDEIVRWAKQKLKPQVDWRRELRAAVQGALAWTMGLEDYSYTRPNRRQSALPQVVLPSLRKPLPRVAVVVDTSGSMGEGELAQALAEIGAVLRQVREVTVLSVDAAVHEVRRVFRAEQVQLVGGGGTDMGVGIAAAQRLRPPPQVLVVVTDGYTDWPQNPPRGMRVVVALTTEEKDAPAWARAVRCIPTSETKE